MRTKLNMRKSEPKPKKKVSDDLDIIEIQLNRSKVEAATKLLPPVPKKLKRIKTEPGCSVRVIK